MIVKGNDYVEADDRFKSWQKMIDIDTIDPSADGGYAITSKFMSLSESISLERGQWLLIAHEQGSRKNHYYRYHLVDSTGYEVQWDEIELEVRECKDERLLCNALNSKLFMAALYCYMQIAKVDGEPVVDDRIQRLGRQLYEELGADKLTAWNQVHIETETVIGKMTGELRQLFEDVIAVCNAASELLSKEKE